MKLVSLVQLPRQEGKTEKAMGGRCDRQSQPRALATGDPATVNANTLKYYHN
jgi:hypothetical protein